VAIYLDIFWVALSYFAGSFLPSYFFVKALKGHDIRELGDRNPGSYNAGKILGRKWGALTGLIDIGKGILMPLIPIVFKMPHANIIAPLSAIAVVCGHACPFYLRFRGGMGMAPSVGALTVISIWEMIYVLSVWAALLLLLLIIRQKEKRGIAQFCAFLLLIPLQIVFKESLILIISSSVILFHMYLRRFILKKTIF
jgi:glycerol-3-phosphate acyltransferase PlsY